jgi:hypothetical protein
VIEETPKSSYRDYLEKILKELHPITHNP